MSLEKTIADVESITAQYRKENPSGGDLVDMMRRLSANLAYLQGERAKYHEQWQAVVFRLTENGKAVNRAENEAHVTVKELYLLRRIMQGGYSELDVMRSQLSWLKKEMDNLNSG